VFEYPLLACFFTYQTWPTEAEIAMAYENQKKKKIKKRSLPHGT